MALTVDVTFRAQLQILDILAYLNEHSPIGARRFQQRLNRAYMQLSEFPLSGTRIRRSNVRRVILAPYVLTYRVTANRVEVLDVRHGRQRPMPVSVEP